MNIFAQITSKCQAMHELRLTTEKIFIIVSPLQDGEQTRTAKHIAFTLLFDQLYL